MVSSAWGRLTSGPVLLAPWRVKSPVACCWLFGAAVDPYLLNSQQVRHLPDGVAKIWLDGGIRTLQCDCITSKPLWFNTICKPNPASAKVRNRICGTRCCHLDLTCAVSTWPLQLGFLSNALSSYPLYHQPFTLLNLVYMRQPLGYQLQSSEIHESSAIDGFVV